MTKYKYTPASEWCRIKTASGCARSEGKTTMQIEGKAAIVHEAGRVPKLTDFIFDAGEPFPRFIVSSRAAGLLGAHRLPVHATSKYLIRQGGKVYDYFLFKFEETELDRALVDYSQSSFFSTDSTGGRRYYKVSNASEHAEEVRKGGFPDAERIVFRPEASPALDLIVPLSFELSVYIRKSLALAIEQEKLTGHLLSPRSRLYLE